MPLLSDSPIVDAPSPRHQSVSQLLRIAVQAQTFVDSHPEGG